MFYNPMLNTISSSYNTQSQGYNFINKVNAKTNIDDLF